ncbi:MAG TPA: lysophospholipid acyltransferase family protein [Chthoniobacteraceae bacterium]|nr:lysophospholipid acyltransferase family protein [Chthoniobacteraceae bacterium]
MDDWNYRPAADQQLKPGDSMKSVRREAGLIGATTQFGWRVLTRLYLLTYHRLEVHGLEYVPDSPPFVLVANHASHLDALVLAAALPWHLRRSAFPIAAGDTFFETKATTVFAAMMLNALPMWRKRCGSHGMAELRSRLVEEPAIYLLFPEGTRSRTGEIGSFKPGLGMLLGGADVPVVPCHLKGAFEALRPGARWPKPEKLVLRMGAPLRFNSLPNDKTGWRAIAEQLEQSVRHLAKS